MRLENVSNLEALVGVLGVLAFGWLVLRLVPQPAQAPPVERYDADAIRAHDRALAKYVLVATVALTIGALHLALRNVPTVAVWLMGAGHGGHLVRDIAYSHMIIVLGGTVAVTGLTWYALPRVVQRPLYSEVLAHLSFWCTVVGAAGFYLSNVVAGTAMGAMVHAGMSDAAANTVLGLWRALPTGGSALVMGIGYWTFAINVLATVWLGRRLDAPRPERHLAGFFVIGAVGLLIGTVHGVFQVLPDNEAWLAAAGAAGEYIDPIAHAHVNLLTGTLTLVAGLAFFFTRTDRGADRQRRHERSVFWMLVPGSLAFYVTFLALGFSEGSLVVNDGLSFAAAVHRMGWWHTAPLIASGVLTLAGLWSFVAIILRRFLAATRPGHGAALVVTGAAVLLVGTAQGAVQMVPPVKAWMVSAGAAGYAVASAHAQLNMLGAVLPMLLGLALVAPVALIGREPRPGLSRRAAIWLGGGAGTYYVAALATAYVQGQGVRAGQDAVAAFAQTQPAGGIAMMAGAGAYAFGAATLAAFAWRVTGTYRAAGWRAFKEELARHNSAGAPWRARIPLRYLLLPEAAAAAFGFPGVGWILSGRALVGVPLIFGGSTLAWAVLPLLMSPYGEGALPHLPVATLQVYLAVSTIVSVLTLARAVRSGRPTGGMHRAGRPVTS